MEQKITQAETKLANLKQSILTEQERSTALKQQNDKDFEVLRDISKQKLESEFKNKKSELENLHTILKTERNNNKITIETYIDNAKTLTDEIKGLERDKEILTETNNILRSDITYLESKKTIFAISISELEKTEADTSSRISELKIEESELVSENGELLSSITMREKEIKILGDEFIAKEAKLTHQIGILQGKSDDLSNEIIERQAQDNQTRENLADWARKLDDKENNLRIREAKVTQQQGAIIRNSNLLNL